MGIFQSIIGRFKEAKQQNINKEEFRNALLNAVVDGRLTHEEVAELERMKAEFGLSDLDIQRFKADVFAAAFKAITQDKQVTDEEERELKQIQKYLGLVDSDIEYTVKELARLRLLGEIQQGNIPTIQVENLVMQKGEKACWVEPGILVEEKVVSRRFEGGSHGVSIPIYKGVRYRVGAYRGHLVSETGNVPVSEGKLVITNKRVVFSGDRKSFSVKLDKILDIQLFANTLIFSEINKTKPKFIQFVQQGNQDIVGAILSFAINSYGK